MNSGSEGAPQLILHNCIVPILSWTKSLSHLCHWKCGERCVQLNQEARDPFLCHNTFVTTNFTRIVGSQKRFHYAVNSQNCLLNLGYCCLSVQSRGWRYVLKIHFFIEFGLKIIQFKTKSKIFIQKFSYNRVQTIQQNYSFIKNVENYSKFQNRAKIWLRSPPEALV